MAPVTSVTCGCKPYHGVPRCALLTSGCAVVCCILQVEPGVFRGLHTFMQDTTHRTGRIEVLSFAITAMDGPGAEDFNTLPAAAAPAALGTGLSTAADGSSSAAAAAAAGVSGRSEPAGTSTPSRQQQPVRQHRAGAAAAAAAAATDGAGSSGRVLYARGSIGGLPEEFASRKERFAELDQLQQGWQVELRSRGDTVDAVFYAPEGAMVGTFAAARRQALAARKAAAGAVAVGV